MLEKIYNPSFGTVIWDLLFEPFTEVVKEQIVNDINTIINSDPRVRVNAMEVQQKDYGIQIACVLTYVDYDVSEALRFNFDRSNAVL